MLKRTLLASALSSLFFLSGCATAPITPKAPIAPPIPEIYHRVEKGQTLWRISKMYDTDLDSLVKANRLADAASIETGQMILIPEKRQQGRPLATRYPLDDFAWPAKGRVTSSFGQTSGSMVNKGIDITVSGQTDITAARTGKVAFCSENFSGYGKTIILDHGDGFLTVYARNSRLLVKPGDIMAKGSPIAIIEAGKDKNKYLHFEIRKGSAPQNPVFYLP